MTRHAPATSEIGNMKQPASSALTYSDLKEMARTAETGEQWAEICRLEAEMLGGPFYCPKCGIQLSSADTAPCSLDHEQNECAAGLK